MDIRSIIAEFKEFTSKGNFFDLAIAFVAGSVFNKTIQSLVNDVILPPIGSLLHNIDFNNLFISLNGTKYETLAEAQRVGAPTINYGLFINNLIGLLITVWAVFMLVRFMNRIRRGDKGKPLQRDCPYCTKQIPIKATRCPECTALLKSAKTDKDK